MARRPGMTEAATTELVETSSGTVAGRRAGSVAAFLGIPYGAAPLGHRRFKPADRPQPWTGIRDVMRWGPRSYQSIIRNPFAVAFPRTFEAIEGDDRLSTVPMSEDCLTLNVWTRAANGDARPVLVWLHGGGGCGSPSESRSDGSALTRRGDVVVVSVTHRLNVFGHLYLREMGGDEYAASGNAGTLDLVLALEWVRDNIAGFGGDPRNVTLFGESAGGAKITCLMAIPSARPLFHKAVIQSGADTAGGFAVSAKDAAAFTREFVAELGLTANSWRELLQMPAERLVGAHEAVARRREIPYVLPPPGATLDGVILAQKPGEAAAHGMVADVPLIVGACEDELKLFTMKEDYLARDDTAQSRNDTGETGEVSSTGPAGRAEPKRFPDGAEASPSESSPLVPAGRGALKRWLGDGADAIIAAYSRARPGASADEIEAAIRGDRQFLVPSVRYAEAHLAVNGSPLFMYLFSWKSDVAPQLGTYHSLDIPFFFDRTDAVPVASEDESAAAMAGKMSDALIAFARTGRPDHPDIPQWTPYNTRTRPTMIFARTCRVQDDPHSEERLAWVDVPAERLGF